jgi:hypothetical protein
MPSGHRRPPRGGKRRKQASAGGDKGADESAASSANDDTVQILVPTPKDVGKSKKAAERRARLGPRKSREEEEEERKRFEAEEMKAEVERLNMMREEERTKAVDAAVNRYLASHADAVQQIQSAVSVAQRRAELRAGNDADVLRKYRSSAYRKELKSDLKKGMGFAKRVTAMAEETVAGILKDISTLNLSR